MSFAKDLDIRTHLRLTLTKNTGKKRQVSPCVTSSRFPVCYVLCPPVINNLSGVVKDTGGVSDLERGHDHRHDTYFGSTEWGSCHWVHLLHVSSACYTHTHTEEEATVTAAQMHHDRVWLLPFLWMLAMVYWYINNVSNLHQHSCM